jgi:thiamine kinase-like enzyme
LTLQSEASTPTNNLPLQVDELSAEWLQSVLALQLDGAVISDFEASIIGVGEGFMGQLARITLSFHGEQGKAPGSVIAKFAALAQETRDQAADQKLYQREIGFYRDIGEKAGVPIAKCYYSLYREDSNQFVILMEDLAPGEPSDQVIGTDKETSREVIEQFAKLHAKWWNSPDLEELEWAKWLLKATPMEEGLAMLERSMREAEETGKFDAYPEMKRLMPLLPPLFKFDPAPPYPFTLTHGDLRSDNIIKPTDKGGRFAIIDWQLTGVGDPVNDIVRWMTQSISIEDRKETEQELLKLYHRRLVEYGVKGYSYSKFINAYKTNLIVVFLMFSMPIDTVDKSSDRAQALFHQFYARLDAALVDWEIEKQLKALPIIYPFIKVVLIIQKALGGIKKKG